MPKETFKGKVVVFTAPSGAGKTTIVRHILKSFENIAFSVSATTRPPRNYEQDALHYYFLTKEAFEQKISDSAFIEYEEVYEGVFYGTLKSELERLWADKKHVIFDIDVQGALNIKKHFGNQAFTIFVAPPSMEVLKQRLSDRGTDDGASIEKRVAKFNKEMKFLDKFDYKLVNDNLDVAFKEAEDVVRQFLTTNNDEPTQK